MGMWSLPCGSKWTDNYTQKGEELSTKNFSVGGGRYRHVNDSSNNASGFLGKIYNTLTNINAALINLVQLYGFYNARLNLSRHIEKDLPERLAKALFRVDNPLNVQKEVISAYINPHMEHSKRLVTTS
ncbi:hypothetical protein BDC45DRAFT_564481 [Circinella umbellata]|nr:hypothetical protein BDC45DRAFT_564481 [Circinella umbellata]